MENVAISLSKTTVPPSQSHDPRLTSVFREKSFWILHVLGLLYFSPALFFGKTFFFRDLYLHFFFRKQLLADFLRTWQLPLWNEFLHGGRPYWGDLSNAVLHPSNILYAVLPTITAFNLIIVFHFMLAAAAMYIFARGLGLKPVSSFLAGVVFEFCGYTLSLGNMLGFLLALPYLPFLFLGWHRFLQTSRRRWLLLAMVCGVIQVFAGAPELCVLSLVLLLGWTLGFPYSHVSPLRKIVLWIILGCCLGGLTAIQLIPTIEMITYSLRGAGIPYQAFAQWSLHPKRLAEFVFPGLSGFLDQFPWDTYYWGKNLVDLKYPYVISIYFGGVALVLACVAVLRTVDLRKTHPPAPSLANERAYFAKRGKEEGDATNTSCSPSLRKRGGRGVSSEIKAFRLKSTTLPVRVRRILFLIAGGSLLLAFGRFLPGFNILYTYVPLISIFRYPVKFFMASIFPVALLAAYAADSLFLSPDGIRISRKILIAASVPAGLLVLFAALFRFSDTFAASCIAFWFGDIDAAVARHDLNQTFLHTAAIWLLFVGFLYIYRRQRRMWQTWLLAGIVTLDLLIAGIRVNPYASQDFFTVVPETVPLIRQELEGGRFYRTKESKPTQLLDLPSTDLMWGDRWNLEMLNSSLPAIYGIPLIFHVDYDRLAHQHISTLDALLDALPWERRLPILSAGNVTIVMTPDRIDIPGFKFIRPVPNRSTTPFYLYHTAVPANRIEFVSHWQRVTSDKEALGALLAPDYNPRTRVILQDPPETSWPSSLRKKTPHTLKRIEISSQPVDITNITGSDCQPAQITSLSHSSTKEILSIANACEGYLVFSEPHYPGWTITTDDQSAPILRANYAFSAVFLTAGEHRVERTYRPTSVIVGGGISLGFCGLVALWMFASKKT